MRDMLPALALLLLAAAACAQPITELAFIDHNNLRYPYKCDEQALRSQTAEIKQNLDRAAHYGIATYVLFSRGFESMVNYDFAVDDLGDLSNSVYPPESDHRKSQALCARYLTEVLDYAEKLGIRVYFHTNQFDFPTRVYELAGDRLAGSARVCPGKPLGHNLLMGKIEEFFRRFPNCAGLQLTLSETQVKITECVCDACKGLSDDQRFLRVVGSAAQACRESGKALVVRTWGGFGENSTTLGLPEGVICSTKHTSGDFHLNSEANELIGQDAANQEVEFDAWGEYSGYNLFPCYMGDIFASRVRLCAERGVKRLAVRLNWNHDINWIFGRPYGNEVNVFLFTRLAANPQADPDALLRDYIAEVYPPSAREAAFRLYKRSVELQRVWLTWRGPDAIDHSRVFNGGLARVESQVGRSVREGYATTRALITQRRTAIDAAYREALELVDALGPDVPADWKNAMKRGARTQWFVAQANSDCIVLLAAHREMMMGRPLPDFSALEHEMRSRARLWERTDPGGYITMFGSGAIVVLDDVKQAADEHTYAKSI